MPSSGAHREQWRRTGPDRVLPERRPPRAQPGSQRNDSRTEPVALRIVQQLHPHNGTQSAWLVYRRLSHLCRCGKTVRATAGQRNWRCKNPRACMTPFDMTRALAQQVDRYAIDASVAVGIRARKRSAGAIGRRNDGHRARLRFGHCRCSGPRPTTTDATFTDPRPLSAGLGRWRLVLGRARTQVRIRTCRRRSCGPNQRRISPDSARETAGEKRQLHGGRDQTKLCRRACIAHLAAHGLAARGLRCWPESMPESAPSPDTWQSGSSDAERGDQLAQAGGGEAGSLARGERAQHQRPDDERQHRARLLGR